jgi:hypothetical protein
MEVLERKPKKNMFADMAIADKTEEHPNEIQLYSLKKKTNQR